MTTLYDFWAPWCAPCRAMEPAIKVVEARFAGRLTVRKVNVDEEPELAQQFGVRSIPTLVLVDTEERLRLVGGKTFDEIEKKLEEALKPA